MNHEYVKHMRLILILMSLLLAGCTMASSAQTRLVAALEGAPDAVTAVAITNESGVTESDVPVTFALPFVKGDIADGAGLVARLSDGSELPIQVDVKTRHPDESLAHAVITVLVPRLESGDSTQVLLSAEKHRTAKTSTSVEELPQTFDAIVRVSDDGETYTASARDLLKTQDYTTWLSGPLVSEWIVRGPLRTHEGEANPNLAAQFAIRYYRATDNVRVSVVVENDWTYVSDPQPLKYDVTLTVAGDRVFAEDNLIQYAQTRWRKVFWWHDAPETYVRFSLPYLKATHTIPNYAPDLQIPEKTLEKMVERLAKSDTGPGGAAIVYKAMPAAGGRGDIGPLPIWTARYLISMDRRAWKTVKAVADSSGSWAIHFRDQKTGLPLSLVDHPKASAHYMLRGKYDYSIPAIGKRPADIPKSELKPNTAHEPSMTFVPYLLTGDYYYLEELQFWTVSNRLRTTPAYRGFNEGLLNWLPVRAQAWALRALVQAAYATPDDHPMKQYWAGQLENNLDYYNGHYASNPDANALHVITHIIVYNHHRGIAPWQNDFFTWAIGYVAQLGYEKANPIWHWQAQFPVNRMLAPGYCYVYASAYSLNIRDDRHSPIYDSLAKVYAESIPAKAQRADCGSGDMADLLGWQYKPGDMYGYPWSPQGYPANMQPALASAVDAGVEGAEKAWKLFMSRPTKPDYSSYPNWDIVPRE